MPHYMLSVHMDPTQERPPMTEEDMAGHMTALEALETDMHDKGAWLFSARMHGPESASVGHHRDGTRAVTDGPYIETKEHLGGFYVITAADLDEALEWADRTSATVGMPIEVRPFAGFSEEPHRSQ